MADEQKSADRPTIGMPGHGSGDGPLFFLTAMPGKGGSCTDVKAWSCKLPEFVPIPIRLDNWNSAPHASPEDLMLARLDVPHGVSVKIAASVNVVVVFSPSVSKVWIASAKLSGPHGTESVSTIGSRKLGPGRSVEGTAGSAEAAILKGMAKVSASSCNSPYLRGGKEDREGCLHFIKCAVVDCNGPVYSMHLSLQHLLLGQLGGVRVWALRPLIKGTKFRRKKDLKVDATDASKGNLVGKGGFAWERTEAFSNGEAGMKDFDRFRGLNAVTDSTACEGTGSMKEGRAKAPNLIMAEPKNGFYGFEVASSTGNIKSGMKPISRNDNVDGSIDQTGGSATILTKQQENDLCGKSYKHCLCEGACSKSRQNGGEMHMGNGPSDLQHAVSRVSKAVYQEAALEQVAIQQCSNGKLSCDQYDSEEWHSQQILSQSSMLSSFSGVSCVYTVAPAFHSVQAAACANSPSCSSVTSSSFNVAGAGCDSSSMEVPGVLNSAKFMKGAQDGFFVPLQSEKLQDNASKVPSYLARLKQAVSIYGLSEREFVILDSSGKLHILTLQQSVPVDNQREQRGPKIVTAALQPLNCYVRIKVLAVLPCLQNAMAAACSASRTLWISDGGHTIHIVALPAREFSDERMGKSSLQHNHLRVIQTIFTAERICSLAALSVNMVMVLTEGSILAYCMVET